MQIAGMTPDMARSLLLMGSGLHEFVHAEIPEPGPGVVLKVNAFALSTPTLEAVLKRAVMPRDETVYMQMASAKELDFYDNRVMRQPPVLGSMLRRIMSPMELSLDHRTTWTVEAWQWTDHLGTAAYTWIGRLRSGTPALVLAS